MYRKSSITRDFTPKTRGCGVNRCHIALSGLWAVKKITIIKTARLYRGQYGKKQNALVTLLAHRSWRDLRSVAHAHRLYFNSNHKKETALQRLLDSLIGSGGLRRCLRKIDESERDALTAVQAAGGQLSLRRFTAAFGTLRILHTPRSALPRHPWKRPVSAAEHLWYLGLIEILPGQREDTVVLLPPLQAPVPLMETAPSSIVSSLMTDLAHLLGVLAYEPVRPVHGRWLPPTIIQRIIVRLSDLEEVSAVRSEFQTLRLRFLHYLAVLNNLIAVQHGQFQLTPEAGRWADLPPTERWARLWSALNRDLSRRRGRLWDTFRMPSLDRRLWIALTQALEPLVPSAYDLNQLLATLRPHLLDFRRANTQIRWLLTGPLTWMGRVQVQGNRLTLASHAVPPDQPGLLTVGDASLHLHLSPNPPLVALLNLCAWNAVTDNALIIDADAVARASERGITLAQLRADLSEMIGQPLPCHVDDLLTTWHWAAGGLELQHLTVLTARDPDTLSRIRADWRLRPLLGPTLSPHHLAVRAVSVNTVLQRLDRRGLRVTNHVPASKHCELQVPDTLSPALAEYVWLAMRVYQKLGALVRQPIRLPADARNQIAASLPYGMADALETEAQTLIDRLSTAMSVQSNTPAPLAAQTDPEALYDLLDAACRNKTALTIEYFSPAYGQKTIRTIHPKLLYRRSGAVYVEAECELEEEKRTFRLDRILRLLQTRTVEDGGR